MIFLAYLFSAICFLLVEVVVTTSALFIYTIILFRRQKPPYESVNQFLGAFLGAFFGGWSAISVFAWFDRVPNFAILFPVLILIWFLGNGVILKKFKPNSQRFGATVGIFIGFLFKANISMAAFVSMSFTKLSEISVFIWAPLFILILFPLLFRLYRFNRYLDIYLVPYRIKMIRNEVFGEVQQLTFDVKFGSGFFKKKYFTTICEMKNKNALNSYDLETLLTSTKISTFRDGHKTATQKYYFIQSRNPDANENYEINFSNIRDHSTEKLVGIILKLIRLKLERKSG